MSLMVKTWLSFLLLALTAYGGYSLWRINQLPTFSAGTPTKSTSPQESSSIPNLDYTPTLTWDEVSSVTLEERSGQPYPLAQLKGKVWVLSFFFASCPGSCRQINNNLATIQKEFAEKKQDVTIVSVTVDPEIDTPEVLGKYAESFGADPKQWVFLTGKYETIRDLATDIFKMPMQRRTHHDRVVLVNQLGEIEKTYNTARDADVASLHKKVTTLLTTPPVKVEIPAPVSTPAASKEAAAL